jgi:acetolactate synthase-1/2/3 large subunit
MANGYARARGLPGVVCTIPGPGFTYALTGLAEALLDSAPVVHVVGAPASRPGDGYALQARAQSEIAAPLVKQVVTVERNDELERSLVDAFNIAAGGEPGPVVVQVPERLLREPAASRAGTTPARASAAAAAADVDTIADRLAEARRPLLLCGQGAADAASLVEQLAESLPVPVVTTTSGRGVLSERHPLSLPFDSQSVPPSLANELAAAADLVVAVGVKFSHNATFGFSLRLPAERLVRVDASREALARGYPAAVAVEADAGHFLEALWSRLGRRGASEWTEDAVEEWRRRLAGSQPRLAEPRMAGMEPSAVFGALRRSLPDTGVVTTDSGLHQYLVRRHLAVFAPRTLLVPTNFQSMGFGLPAAIGVAVATGRTTVAVIGDGGFAISGLELATAVHNKVPLVVLVLVDRYFGLIRRHQLKRTGHESGVELPAIDPALVAAAVGATHRRLDSGNLDTIFAEALASGGVTVIEVPVEDAGLRRERAVGLAVAATRSVVGVGAADKAVGVVRRRRA